MEIQHVSLIVVWTWAGLYESDKAKNTEGAGETTVYDDLLIINFWKFPVLIFQHIIFWISPPKETSD